MKIITYIKKEFRCADFKYAFIFALVFLLSGIISYSVGGRSTLYDMLLLPQFAPSVTFFVIIWVIWFLALGAAAGFAFSNRCRCSSGSRTKGLVLSLVNLVFICAWYPIFFSMHAYSAALFLITVIFVTSFITMKKLFRASITSGIIMFFFLIWLIFAFVLNFCVIILN